MNVLLVHHADAVGPHVDPQRPLSPTGRAQAEAVARALRDAGARPAAIWHSGKLRARQTAEPIWQACNPFASFTMVRGLRPEDSPVLMRDQLVAEEQDVLLVGHMPHLPELARLLAGCGAFPTHGAVWLERQPDGSYVERWRFQPA